VPEVSLRLGCKAKSVVAHGAIRICNPVGDTSTAIYTRLSTAVKARLKCDTPVAVVDLKIHLERARKKRWDTATKQQKQAAASHASRAYWDALTAEQRSEEMKRRAKKRTRKKR
jgi:hypothetical protein